MSLLYNNFFNVFLLSFFLGCSYLNIIILSSIDYEINVSTGGIHFVYLLFFIIYSIMINIYFLLIYVFAILIDFNFTSVFNFTYNNLNHLNNQYYIIYFLSIKQTILITNKCFFIISLLYSFYSLTIGFVFHPLDIYLYVFQFFFI